MGLGAPEVILIAVVVLLLFGGKKLPELMSGLGKGVREFKDAKDGNGNKEEKVVTRTETEPVAVEQK